MELYSAEYNKIQSLINGWLIHPEQELESTFGTGGEVNATTFLAIAQRLRAKGYDSLPQDDRLSILTPQKVRLSVQGLGVIQQYCRDDRLISADGKHRKPFTAMIKDRTGVESNVDLEEYSTRIKSRREVPLADTDVRVREILDGWNQQQKAYRLIRRWTFKGKGIRIDMSVVRSSPVDSRKEYKWARSFLETNIFKQPPRYEVEVELLRGDDTNTKEKALSCLIKGVGEILRAIQKNTLLIRNSVKEKVISSYSALNGSTNFRGVSPVTLEVKNMLAEPEDKVPNIRLGYNVTDKADGLRTMGFCDATGELFLIDMAMNVYKTGLKSATCRNSIVDGEWVTKSKDDTAINHYLIFDIYRAPEGIDVSQLPFAILDKADEDSRYNRLTDWITNWTTGETTLLKEITELTKFRVSLKNFIFAPPGTEIFKACTYILDTPHIYHTDGLILTPNIKGLPVKSGDTFYDQFKWKPSKDNTIDFLINYEKDPEVTSADKVTTGIHPDNGETINYKTMRLYVGAAKDPAYDDPRKTILDHMPLPIPGKSRASYKPILFNPIDFPDTMASICYREVTIDPESGNDYVTTEDSSEPIPDRCIVECRYVPENSPGWRWVPMRIRHDKTERLLRGTLARTLNSEKVAISVWNSINNPITNHMIRTGDEEPSEEEMTYMVKEKEEDIIGRKYYERKAQKEDLALVRGLRDFHNKWIKDIILYKSILAGGGKSVLDLAVGKAGDLQRWRRGNVKFVLGVDTAGDNIRDPANGAYRRYMDTIITNGRERVPEMVFAIGNSSKPLVTGEAGATPEEADILRAIFAQVPVQGSLPKDIEMNASRSLINGTDVAVCMFALHYFFENKSVLDGFLNNLKSCVKVGGYFAGCCFDGQLVFNMLSKVEKGSAKVGKEGDVPVWSITKEYEIDDFVSGDESVGLPVDVEFISIGAKHREYLVNFEYLTKRLKEIGFKLLDDEEKKAVGLQQSTNLFDESYKMALNAKKKFVMTDTVKEFSFLNRWFIFKRAGELAVPDVKELVEETAIEEKVVGEPVDKKYALGEILRVSSTAITDDGKWLAPSAYFPIIDTTDKTPEEPDGIKYPSMLHYIASMKLKNFGGAKKGRAFTKKELRDLAVNLFSSSGAIHQRYLASGKTTKDKEEEEKSIATELNKYAFNVEGWNTDRDTIYREALTQRFKKDARFNKILSDEKNSKKRYILYSIGKSGASDLGGVRKANGTIEGENRIGKIMMELVGYSA